MLPLYMYILCENNYPLITLPGNGNGIFSLFFCQKQKEERKEEGEEDDDEEEEEEEEDSKEAVRFGYDRVHVQTYGFTLWDST